MLILKEAIEKTLTESSYQHSKVSAWSTQIVEQSVRKLSGLNKPYKYVVTSLIFEKNGAGMHTASSCFWDSATDGSATYRWENKAMHCITTCYAMAL